MSRNFELLRRLGKAWDFNPAVPARGERVEPGAVSAGPSSASPVHLDPASLEEINAVAQQVFLAAGADSPRTVVLTSTDSGTGCTWVCAHLGEVLASRIAGSVCLVDANLRAPGLHAQFGLDNQCGLAEALLESQPIRGFARCLTRPNFWLITSGLGIEAAQSLLSADRMRLRLTELRAEFDFVLIDAPALSAASDALSLSGISDGVVLVLQASASRRQAARRAIQELQGNNAKVLGAVLNRRTFPIPDSIYKRL
jgi:Mrp family chromosome partitioning ATPase